MGRAEQSADWGPRERDDVGGYGAVGGYYRNGRNVMTQEPGLLIDQEQVRHIGFLIRMALTDDEVEMFSEQLSGIVDYFDRLAEVDVTDVLPYRQPPMTRAQLREDVVRPSMAREDFLANAPQRSGGYVKVPVVAAVVAPVDVPDEDVG